MKAKPTPKPKAKKRPGRRPMPAAEKKSRTLTIKVSDQIYLDAYRAAALEKLQPYIWCRRALELAIDEVFKRHGITTADKK